jgi:autotransporter adhesin
MAQQNTMANKKIKSSGTMSWQQVLQFGAASISENMQGKDKKVSASAFIVLP